MIINSIELFVVPEDMVQQLIERRHSLDLSIGILKSSLAIMKAQMAMGVYDPARTVECHTALLQAYEIKKTLDKYFTTLN